MQENLKERSLDYEREREKIIDKMKNNEDYYEKLVEGELNEKQEIYRELNELKGEFEKLSGNYLDIQQGIIEKEKENNEEISEKTKKKNSAEFVKRKNQKKFTFLIHFLLFNGNLSLSEFLICLRKDKKNYDELNLDGLDKYNKFFEVDSKFFLHFNEETKAKYLKIKSSNSKKKICIIFKKLLKLLNFQSSFISRKCGSRFY